MRGQLFEFHGLRHLLDNVCEAQGLNDHRTRRQIPRQHHPKVVHRHRGRSEMQRGHVS